eukprot:GFKZ01016070.1.p1 GENE.GFKZ01016070.1~~GFKZ01016070.1.p1  ORF type:complete len:364 (+),score=31.48 GFKZ01016070.1:411-1502(+)
MSSHRNQNLQPQTPTSSSIPYLGPPPTAPGPPSTLPLPPPSCLPTLNLHPSPHSTPRFTPPVVNVTNSSTRSPFSSTPPQPVSQPPLTYSRSHAQSVADIHQSTADSRLTLPPISPSTPLSLNRRLPGNDVSQLRTRQTWPPLYSVSSGDPIQRSNGIPRLPGMEVVVISDNDDIQQPLRKRRREASAARRQRRRRAEYRLREEAVVEAAKAVERRRTAQLRAQEAYASGMLSGTGMRYGSSLGTGVSGGVSGDASMSLGYEAGKSWGSGVGPRVTMGPGVSAGSPNATAVQVVSGSAPGASSTVPRIPQSLASSAKAPATNEDSAKLMKELRETVLALDKVGMGAEAKALVQQTLPKLLKED